MLPNYPKVSVCITTYNHEKYIAQALDGALMQLTDFEYDILVGEDDSSDETRIIVKVYAKKYPDKIRLFLNSRENVIYINGRPTGSCNFVNNLMHARGKYIALCDGDDYWTDPHKLQKQVDFLETNPDCPICFHPVFWLEQDTGQMHVSHYGAPGVKPYYTLDDLLEHSNFIPTASVIFRNHLIPTIPDWFVRVPFGDLPLHILNLHYSGHDKIGFINEPMAVYRRHSGGVYGGSRRSLKFERLLQTYLIFGANLGLLERVSSRRGISKWYTALSETYSVERRYDRSVSSAYQAVRCAPKGNRMRILLRNVAALMPSIYGMATRARRVIHLIYKSVCIQKK